MACRRAAAAKCVPPALSLMGIDCVNDGFTFTWESVGETVVSKPLV
jgi:hypothetical protein